MKRFLLTCSVFLFAVLVSRAQDISIIPQPLSVVERAGTYSIDPQTKIIYEKGNVDLRAIGEKLSDQIEELTGFHLDVTEGTRSKAEGNIYLGLDKRLDTLGDEGYRLVVDENGIEASAKREAGIFYAAQTIYQLVPTNRSDEEVLVSAELPAVEITDKPRFGWRGLMLDVGRYFYSVDFIKEYIDNIAMHKMNTFHWHLT